jgi:hypothetical protein
MAGFAVWLACCALLRRPPSAALPFLLTLAVALWNEVSDLLLEVWPDPVMQYGEAAKDVLLTMSVPAALMVASRAFPGLPRRLSPRALLARARARRE